MIHRRFFVAALVACSFAFQLTAQTGGELRFALRAEPKTFHPLEMASEEASQTIRFLTSGVLVRLNRETQELEPALATEWKLIEDGRGIQFTLRQGVAFSDGTPFTARDVEYTMSKLMAPDLHSPVADQFRSTPGEVETKVLGAHKIQIDFPGRVSGLAALFDEVSILSAGDPEHRRAVLGPFVLDEYKAGSYVRLRRNPHYWKLDEQGRRLPYLDSLRLDIERNEQIELQRYRRGEFQLMNSLSAEAFEYLERSSAGARDAGPSLDVEFFWFNQASAAPVEEYKRRWFQSQQFRLAISEAINRDDLCRIAYNGRATPAASITSPANRLWFNSSLKPRRYDPSSAINRLLKEGFRKQGETLMDSQGRTVEFSLITNAGNKARERLAAMIQQDLAKIGIRLNIVALDFQSLIARIGRTLDYEACLLGLVNVDLDPNGQMNIWLSSATNHPWNPKQEEPATPWEAEIDRLMRAQGAAKLVAERKGLFDQVQQIAFEQAPLVYLVHRNTLFAVSPKLRNVRAGLLWPQVFWDVDRIRLDGEVSQARAQ